MTKKILLKVLNEIVYDADPGIYPKSYVGKYEERTEYMNGWNAALIRQAELIDDILKKYNIEI